MSRVFSCLPPYKCADKLKSPVTMEKVGQMRTNISANINSVMGSDATRQWINKEFKCLSFLCWTAVYSNLTIREVFLPVLIHRVQCRTL